MRPFQDHREISKSIDNRLRGREVYREQRCGVRMQDVTEPEQNIKSLRDEGMSILLVCEHASNFIPEKYNGLGLTPDEQMSHIAWDPGALAVAKNLQEQLNASLVACEYSRLLYDCNRSPDQKDAICEESDGITIPGNKDLSAFEKNQRIQQFYMPFKERITSAVKDNSVIVTIHSFTPVYSGEKRDVEIGILHDTDTRLADALLSVAKNATIYDIQRNEPYSASDGVTHTLKVHAVDKGRLNVMFEIRNDLIRDVNSQKAVAGTLCNLLQQALFAITREKTRVRTA